VFQAQYPWKFAISQDLFIIIFKIIKILFIIQQIIIVLIII